MRGSTCIRFTDLFADTVRTHGAAWARDYYMRNGMPDWEFSVWLAGFHTSTR